MSVRPRPRALRKSRRAETVFIKSKAQVALVLAILLVQFYPVSATAATDKYLTLQKSVGYTIYKPANTLKLAPLNFEVRPCRLFPKKDKYLLAGFGGMDLGIALVETSAQFNCTGIDNPKLLGTVFINGIKAKVGIYCSGATCTAAKFASVGGEITFLAPASKKFKATFIRIGTQGGFTQAQLIAFAKGLQPVL